jgi:hypothetical protein
MTTSTTTAGRHWTDYLRYLAPGPVALGMQSCFDPAVWHATWAAAGLGRLAPRPQERQGDTAREARR